MPRYDCNYLVLLSFVCGPGFRVHDAHPCCLSITNTQRTTQHYNKMYDLFCVVDINITVNSHLLPKCKGKNNVHNNINSEINCVI